MTDFIQQGPVTTIHDLGTVGRETLESMMNAAARYYRIGLVLPITASDMRAEPFARIVEELKDAEFLERVVVVLNRAPEEADYRETAELIAPLGETAQILWTDGPRISGLIDDLNSEDFHVSTPGKGRAVWSAFGYLLGDPKLDAFVLHDCDIANYDREMLIRLCLPMAHPSMDFDFCKAYYARCNNRMYGRVVRLLITPLLQALITVIGHERFLVYLSSFRYPLSGEFAVSSMLARSNRIPSDWGLEVGTLAEVYRNTSQKRICQVDLGQIYEHKHQPLSLEDPSQGLMAMAADILGSIYRTLTSRGVMLSASHFNSIRAAYLRAAQDCIRQYHADALINNIEYDRHGEESTIEGFAEQITTTGRAVCDNPSKADSMPTWTRVLAAFPDFPRRLREAASADWHEYS